MATNKMPMSNVAGGGNTPLPIPMAAIMRGGPHGLAPLNIATMPISSIMNTAPAMIAAQMAALAFTRGASAIEVCIGILPVEIVVKTHFGNAFAGSEW
ncbi:MAG: hypothetical protein ABIP16_04705 [Thermomonas sp.]